MIPVFVLDRPVSLRILERLKDYKEKFGILAHVYTSDNFKNKFASFDLTEFKIGDSGIYQKNTMNYDELFEEYEKMNVKYGIIKDFYRDPKRTFESAEIAKKYHRKGNYHFNLMGVAQGNTVAEYVKSYQQQRTLFDNVAIGGLLDKIDNHVRMVRVKSDVFLDNVLHSIRILHPTDNLFPLGVFNKKRINMFERENIWASDYKGWIFRYDINQSHKNNDRMDQTVKNLINLLKFIEEKRGCTSVDHPLKPRLLILSCSMKKTDNGGKAVDVYDGPSYRMLRKYLKNKRDMDVKIISAKYGLIDGSDRISPYDNKMKSKDALIYKKIYESEISKLASKYDDVRFYGGKLYKSVIYDNHDIVKIDGRIGCQLHQLKQWLYGQELVLLEK